MDRLIYTALSGMNASMVSQRMIANNMANANTIGFRAEVMASTPATLKGPSLEVRALGNGQVRGARMEQGPISSTGRPLDVALNGQALLAVQAADGSEAYTRRGDLSVSANGLLVNGEGYPVIGSGGPISLNPRASISISPEGRILAADPDAPDLPPQELDRLKLASPEGFAVIKGLDNLMRIEGEEGAVLPADESATLVAGALEASNVKPTEVLVEMVEAQRLFDIRTKLISAAREIDEGGASLMRLS
jgi:flagellar basal-body rod protein FlgF